MDINNLTVSGNIWAVVDLLAQGGIDDPGNTRALGTQDVSLYVVLVHGDLGTGERLQAAQLHCSIDATLWNRFQHVILIPSLFHLKMACADAVWQCFLQPLSAWEDETSLMRNVSQLQPKKTSIYCLKPGFRHMHQLIWHAGTVQQLDCWRAHVGKKNRTWVNLEMFTSSEPGLDKLKQIADELALEYVVSHRLYQLWNREPKERNMQFKNTLLLNKYFLLYKELSYSMNHGDIVRVEMSIMTWIPILKAIGKHKYAMHMTTFLLNVHFVYPPGFKKAIRYHILVNPSGKPMKWRAVDWCVELNNLFTQVVSSTTYICTK
ncbi:hypothetical protein PAXRUDRAFT_153718 [Paxillus rubicundulus Ve08.2h10]|uniref:Unplaced genomic scaffold scaffold_800, whole genome shotgun sequence n=1 Tax=Paxillus rubicundulus Ve08.2h10 TaxID=930991 RepID=A0A0D0DDS0_9AGAM|nr:hypothetical protein PAXRUDRAFT_153718 [Paxillus rubicundulus Ve08.2h10]